jgi:hypothetical protein
LHRGAQRGIGFPLLAIVEGQHQIAGAMRIMAVIARGKGGRAGECRREDKARIIRELQEKAPRSRWPATA